MSEIASTKPYLIRALYEWCTDNGYTPYISVKVQGSVQVPADYVRNGEIVLNIAFLVTSDMHMDNEAISFKARFAGVSRDLYIPISAISAIYAKENGQGMGFEVTPEVPRPQTTKAEPETEKTPVSLAVTNDDTTPPKEGGPDGKESRKKPSLTIIK